MAPDTESLQMGLHVPSCSNAGTHGHANRHGVPSCSIVRTKPACKLPFLCHHVAALGSLNCNMPKLGHSTHAYIHCIQPPGGSVVCCHSMMPQSVLHGNICGNAISRYAAAAKAEITCDRACQCCCSMVMRYISGMAMYAHTMQHDASA